VAALYVLLTCLATYRITRLLVADAITEPWRDRVEERYGPESSWAYLVNCPWCTGMWVAIVLTLATDLIVGLPAPVLVAASASAVAGLIAAVEPE
jgi:Protein of unknown function (DUF1360)